MAAIRCCPDKSSLDPIVRDWACNFSMTYQRSTRAVVTRLPVTSEKISVGLLVCVFSIVSDDLCIVFHVSCVFYAVKYRIP